SCGFMLPHKQFIQTCRPQFRGFLVGAAAQNELDISLATGELKLLCILRGQKEGHNTYRLWLTLRVRLSRLASRQDLDVLENGLGNRHRVVRSGRSKSHQQVNMRPGID